MFTFSENPSADRVRRWAASRSGSESTTRCPTSALIRAGRSASPALADGGRATRPRAPAACRRTTRTRATRPHPPATPAGGPTWPDPQAGSPGPRTSSRRPCPAGRSPRPPTAESSSGPASTPTIGPLRAIARHGPRPPRPANRRRGCRDPRFACPFLPRGRCLSVPDHDRGPAPVRPTADRTTVTTNRLRICVGSSNMPQGSCGLSAPRHERFRQLSTIAIRHR